MKIAIVCALYPEAKPLIDHFSLKEKQGFHPFKIYENETISLVLSGIRSYGVSSALSYVSGIWSDQLLSYLNVGIAGHKNLPIGTLCIPSKITSPFSKKDIYPSLMLNLSAKVEPLYTLSEPTSEYFEKALFDMEAYEFFSSALRFTTIEHVACLKVVSDNEKNPPEKITAGFAKALIRDHIDSIDTCVNSLIDLQNQIAHKQSNPIGLNDIHFTQTELIQLEKLVDRHQILNPNSELPLQDLRNKQSAKAVLQSLENILIESPLELL